MKKITARAHANIALIKYWGKRDSRLNLPAVGSLSLTLKALSTTTSVEFQEGLSEDSLSINGSDAGEKQTRRASRFLDLIRTDAGIQHGAIIDSTNNFPTGAGLASSASGFAALTVAAANAAGLNLSPSRLSELSRQGSGSAARSIFGGFVEMKLGEKADGSDSIAVPLHPAEHWPLAMLILITSEAEKPIGSTEGMNLTAETSPYYPAWVNTSPDDIAIAREAIAARDIEKLGEISEFSCFKMHGLAMSANPAIIYWNGLSVTLIHEIRRLRAQGIPAYVTMDAGPQVKVLTLPEYVEKLTGLLSEIEGIRQIINTEIGGDARILTE